MRTFTSVIRLVLGFLMLAVTSVVFLPLFLLLLPSRMLRLKLANLYGKIVGRTVVALAGVRPQIDYPKKIGASMPAIYLVNHTSALDVFLCVWLAPFGCCGIFKKEILRTPFFGQIAAISGHLLIDRENHTRAIGAFTDVADLMRRHRLGALVFPEGTRSKDGRIQPLKKGFVHLAIATRLPVVPIVIQGAHKNWKKGEFFNFQAMDLPIRVLDPIDTTNWSEATAAEHATLLHSIYAENLPEDQRPLQEMQQALA